MLTSRFDFFANLEKNLDEVSGVFGKLCGDIFAKEDDIWYHDLWNMGFYLGKFVYLMDAYEDLEKDEQRGLYNPFLSWKEDNKGTDLDTFVRLILTSMLAECAKSFERLPIINYADILRNILYSGVWTRFEVNQLKKKKKKSTGDLSKEEE